MIQKDQSGGGGELRSALEQETGAISDDDRRKTREHCSLGKEEASLKRLLEVERKQPRTVNHSEGEIPLVFGNGYLFVLSCDGQIVYIGLSLIHI